MSSSSPKTSGNYQSNACYQQSSYTTPYSLGPSPHLHHQQQSLVNNHGPTLSPTSLSVVYANNQQQQQQQQQQMPPGASFNVLQTRYQNDQINEKTSNSLTASGNNGQQQSIPSNAATLAAANAYRRTHFNACAKPPYRSAEVTTDRNTNDLRSLLATFLWSPWPSNCQAVGCAPWQKSISSSWIPFRTIVRINSVGRTPFAIRWASTIVSSKFLAVQIGRHSLSHRSSIVVL